MPPKKAAKRKGKAKAKVGSKKRSRSEEEEQLPDLEDAAEVPAEDAMAKGVRADEDDVPLSDMMPPTTKAKTSDDPQDIDDGFSESLPSFTAATKESSTKAKEMEEDDMPLITAAKLASQGDTTEGDLWQQLEKELEAPLHATMPDAEDINEKTLGGIEEDSDDDWGIKWKGGSDLPGITDVLDEIRKQATSTNWHTQEWAKKEEPRKDDDDDNEEPSEMGEVDQEQRLDSYTLAKEKKEKANDWQPDDEWNSEDAFINSREAMAVENVVRKIRCRAGKFSHKDGIESFPNETMLQVLKTWVKRSLPEQRVALAAVLLVEAQTLDLLLPAPDLNSIGITMLTTEGKLDQMRAACRIAPPHVMLRKADAMIPDLKLREETAPQMFQQLKKKLSSVIAGSDVDIDEDDLGKNVDDFFVDQPMSVQMVGLVHCCEYWQMMKSGFDRKQDLFASLTKQTNESRVFEVLCRVDLRDAVRLAMQTLDENLEPLRKSKIACLNRLASEWVLAPREEDMMLVHMLGLERQIQVLLSIERDIELKWCDLMSKVDGREERSAKLREFLNFSERLRPYLNDEDLLPGKRPIEKESGKKLEINELAMVRQGVSDIFKKLKRMYKWKPDVNSRKAISKTNWVARLAAVLQLAKTTYSLSADKELRKLLQNEASRTLGAEIFKTYMQWKKMEQGDGVQIPRRRVATRAAMEERQRRWQELVLKHYPDEQQRFLPQTPAGLGMAAMTPGLGASMTPGLASMTPGLNPGTPGLSGTITPGFRAPTPMWQSSATPAFKENSEGNTPQWRPASTPLGPSYGFNSFTPGTPLNQQGPGTPVHGNPRTPLPQTPVVKPDAFPGTPVGVPPMTPSGPGGGQPAPMTPPQDRVKNAKEE